MTLLFLKAMLYLKNMTFESKNLMSNINQIASKRTEMYKKDLPADRAASLAQKKIQRLNGMDEEERQDVASLQAEERKRENNELKNLYN